LQDANNTITTHSLPVGSVTTTIQAPRPDFEGDVFNDAEIEKAIEEIREAIDKAAKLTSR
jgi:protein phosphatase